MEQLFELDEHLIKHFCGNNDEGYILEVDVEYLKTLFNYHCQLTFLPERKKTEKFKKLVCNMHNKENSSTHRSLKTSIRRLINAKKVQKMIKFNQKSTVKKIY